MQVRDCAYAQTGFNAVLPLVYLGRMGLVSNRDGLGLRYLGIGRACIGWPPWVGNMAPLSPDTDRTGSRDFAR